jgi:3-phenylpropionate/trans-cinnamate dioxygenase ferredoxin reductase component
MTVDSFAIVGAGLAGARAAQSLRKQGFDGRINLIGAEKHPPYDRPPLSKEVLGGKTSATATYLESDDYWDEQQINLLLGQPVVSLRPSERKLELADGRTLDADKVLLCTGGRPRTLNVSGSALPGVWYLRTIEDARSLREHLIAEARVVVVGAGFIGAEVAATARALGCDVTLVEIAHVPLWRALGEEVGRVYAEVHRDHGVRLMTGVGVDGIAGDFAVRQVILSDGSAIDADVVVIGVGLEPMTELATQAGAGVGNGIIVNEFCETTVPGIYAAGDVANHPNAIIGERVRLEHWQNAQNQAVAAASAMLGGREPFCEVPWFWSDQYGLNLQVAGHPHASDQIVWRGRRDPASFCAFYRKDGLVRAVLGVNRPRDIRAGMDLIARSMTVEADTLADESTDLRALARAARPAPHVPPGSAGSASA